jgi:hypothetical protein
LTCKELCEDFQLLCYTLYCYNLFLRVSHTGVQNDRLDVFRQVGKGSAALLDEGALRDPRGKTHLGKTHLGCGCNLRHARMHFLVEVFELVDGFLLGCAYVGACVWLWVVVLVCVMWAN